VQRRPRGAHAPEARASAMERSGCCALDKRWLPGDTSTGHRGQLGGLELSGWSSWRRHGQDGVPPPVGAGRMQLHLFVQISLNVQVHMENRGQARRIASRRGTRQQRSSCAWKMEEPEAIGWSTFIRRPSTPNTEEEIGSRRTGGGEPGRSGAQGRKAKLCQPAPLTLHTSMSSSSPKIGNKPSNKQDAPAWRHTR
jgi:hypothetical protein